MAEGGRNESITLDGIGGNIEVTFYVQTESYLKSMLDPCCTDPDGAVPPNNWDGRTLKEKLGDASEGGLFRGKVFIYPLWKTLLNKWLAYKSPKVYLVTPFIDEKRLEDVCRIVLYNKAEHKIESFYVRQLCNNNNSISDLQKTVTGKIKSDDKSKRMQTRLESIYEKIADPGKTFHAKFMCCVRESKAEVFITSANFQGSHFDCNNLETVQYITTTKKKFEERFLQPLT